MFAPFLADLSPRARSGLDIIRHTVNHFYGPEEVSGCGQKEQSLEVVFERGVEIEKIS